MDYRNPTILKYIRKLTALMKLRNEFAIFIYIILSPVLVVVEEVINAYQRRTQTREIDKITQKNKGIKRTMKKFDDLTDSEKRSYDNYYEDMSKRNAWSLQVMARESSIQLTLQNALLIYEFLYPPLYQLNYNSSRSPSTRWMFDLALQLLSIMLSAYSTFNGILINMKFKSHVERKPAGLLNYVITVLLVTCHIIIASGIVFLLLGHKFIKQLLQYNTPVLAVSPHFRLRFFCKDTAFL